jgi:hypothetical protein
MLVSIPCRFGNFLDLDMRQTEDIVEQAGPLKITLPARVPQVLDISQVCIRSHDRLFF